MNICILDAILTSLLPQYNTHLIRFNLKRKKNQIEAIDDDKGKVKNFNHKHIPVLHRMKYISVLE